MTVAWLAVAVLAQVGSVEGRVLVAGSGDPIPGATVWIDGADRSATTNADGEYVLASVPGGRWLLRARAAGFDETAVRVLVPQEGPVRVDVDLARRTETARVIGRVMDAGRGTPVPSAAVRIRDGASVDTDGSGRFELATPRPGPVPLVAWAYGYQPVDTVVQASVTARPVEIRLQPRPVGIRPLSVRSRARTEGATAERDLYELEPRPGVIGLAQSEIRDIPPMVEPDVLRALQALPGVVQINDLSARLHVRGGGPDQNLFLLDGARVFAPYHMFGIFGAFNPAAVSRVDFFRGDLPARHGGALSSVIDVEQRDVVAHHVEAEASAGVLSNGAAVRGVLPWVQGRWMLAGRASTIGAVLDRVSVLDSQEFPFSFDDAQARVSVSPVPDHRLTGSWFSSNDAFEMFLEGADGAVASTWMNRVGSVQWLWDPRPDWSTEVAAWSSRYRTTLDIGVGDRVPSTRNEVDVRGLRVEAIRRGRTSVRVGGEVQDGDVELVGGQRAGGYIEGAYRQPYEWWAGYAEIERRVGPVRLAPGVRVESAPRRDAIYLAPRLSARLYLVDEFALTLGASRTYQPLSTIRDDRYALPGPPLWFAHAPAAPVSRADGVSAAVEGWWDRIWSASLSGFARRFFDLPVWRPAGDRKLDDIRFDDGAAHGIEAIVRRHGQGLHGWLSYGYARTRLTEPDDDEYYPTWDRTHSVDLAVFGELGAVTLGGRVVFGTGTPFWGQAGVEAAKVLAPSTGKLEERETFPIWGAEQQRFPDYFRADLVARYRFRWGRLAVEPFAGLLNLTARPNVVYYEYDVPNQALSGEEVEVTPSLEPQTVLLSVPSLGFDIRF